MRVLLDESVPRPLWSYLDAFHQVVTAQAASFGGLANGALMNAAAAAGFQALVTCDTGIPYQTNLDRLPLSVVVMHGRTNDARDLAPLMPRVLDALAIFAVRAPRQYGVVVVSSEAEG